MTFAQGSSGGTVGNNRFDNFTLEGDLLGTDITPPTVVFNPLHNTSGVPTSVTPSITFNEDIRLVSDAAIDNSNAGNLVELRLDDQNGAAVTFTASISGKVITITPASPLLNNKAYYVAVKANEIEDLHNNAIATVHSAIFTTSVFQSGDIVPVAYRMSATDTEDAFAFLTFVDILPGTVINFTDAKYTTNAQAQCAGGLVWTAPSEGIAAGTVVTIQNDVPSVDKGTLSGSGFGLSSNGDQMIVYTGSAASPSYITALSSNNWVLANTSCGGSNSIRPATLTDGTSSINLSTAPGNTSGNTVNAFYNGPQTGSIASLRASVLDPANWVGVGSGTAPQTWPAWSFPGPPSVLSATVITANSIRLIFNRDLDNVSATATANYTGISGLNTIQRTDNGTLADTIVLTYSSGFVNGNSYTLSVSDIEDTEGRTMLNVYTFAFTYNTLISLDKAYISVEENAGNASIKINIQNPSTCSFDLALQAASFNTASATDFTYTTQTISLTETETTKTINIPIVNDSEAEQDEYFVLRLENLIGCTLQGTPLLTVYIRDNDHKAPVATKEIELSFVSRYTVNNPADKEGLAEIVAYDPVSRRLFTMSTGLQQFDIIDFNDPSNPTLIDEIDVSSYGGGVTSIAVQNGIVAVSVPATTSEQDNGSILFYDTLGVFIKQLTAGALPDMITFTPDGKYVLAANEGQPNDAYTNDPEGSISIVDLSAGVSSLTQDDVTTIGFTSFNAQEATLIAAGVRKTKASSTLAQDLEPEYITVASDSKKAWVSLQENNAIAEINLETKEITAIRALGTKDYSLFGKGLDASDRNDFIHIANWPVKGFYMPDAIANYVIGNTTYIITANEGDEKEYAGLNERTTVGAVNLDPGAFPNAAVLKQEHNLGRFRISNLQGDTDLDGDFDELYANGTRSFAIWNASTGALVYESGDDFEKITSEDPYTAAIFNADNGDNAFKGRSRAKGPEPEGVTVAQIGTQTFAFITLERIGGVIVYNVTDPANATFTDYINTRDNSSFGGDNGPEGILYISGQDSPDGKHYVISANEVSGTLAVFEVLNIEEPVTGLTKTSSQEKITIYPNPAKGGSVQLSQTATFELLDATGTLLKTFENTSSADISAFPKGLYMIRFQNGEVKKLILE